MTVTDRLLPHLSPDATNTSFCADVDLSRANKPRATDDATVEEFLAELIAEGQLKDAIRMIARVLHPIHAVQWARACVGDALGETPAKRDADLLKLADDWLADPDNEDLRREAMETAERAEYDGPSAWVLAAAGWSGGSIAPITAPPVEPPEGLAGKAAAGAIAISIGLDHKLADERAQRYLDDGLEFAKLDPPEAAAPPPEPEAEEEDDAPVIRSLVRKQDAPPADDAPGSDAQADAPAPPPAAPDPSQPPPGSLLKRRGRRDF